MPARFLVVLAEIESTSVSKNVPAEDQNKWGGAMWDLVSPVETSVLVQVRPLKILKFEMGRSPDDDSTYERTLFVEVPQSMARKGSKIRVRVSENSETKLEKVGSTVFVRSAGITVRTEYVASSEQNDGFPPALH